MHKSHHRYDNEYRILKNMIKKNNPTVIEIGSNNGGDAIRLIYHFPEIILHCFEIDSRAIEIFKKKINYKNCFLYEYAVHRESGMIEFNEIHLTDKNYVGKIAEKHNWMSEEEYKLFLGTPNSSLSNIVTRENEKIIKKIVPSISLDDWIKDKNIDIIDYLEIDVQGGEKNVILGAKELLKKVKLIKIEYGEKRYKNYMTRKETLELLTTSNFELIENISSKNDSGDLYLKNKYLK